MSTTTTSSPPSSNSNSNTIDGGGSVGGVNVKEKMAWLSTIGSKDSTSSSIDNEVSSSSPTRKVSSPSSNNGSLIANRMKWLKEENEKGPIVSSSSSTSNSSTSNGVIANRMKWLKEENEKGPQTSKEKDQNNFIGKSGIVARQKEWVKQQSEKQLEKVLQVSNTNKMKIDNVEETTITASSSKSSSTVADRLKWVEEEKKRFQPDNGISPTSVRDVVAIDKSSVSHHELPSTCDDDNNNDDIITMNDVTNGCFLTYESDSGGRLMLQYMKKKKEEDDNDSILTIPDNTVGFWCPSPPGKKFIQEFKFKQNGGKSELIKGIAGCDSNRRKYFSGWCTFIKQAYLKDGYLIKYDIRNGQKGIDIDIYGYNTLTNQPTLLNFNNNNNNENYLIDISIYNATAVIPKHKQFLQGVKTVILPTFLEKGNIAGSATTL